MSCYLCSKLLWSRHPRQPQGRSGVLQRARPWQLQDSLSIASQRQAWAAGSWVSCWLIAAAMLLGTAPGNSFFLFKGKWCNFRDSRRGQQRMVQTWFLTAAITRISIWILGQKCFYQPWKDVAALGQLFSQSICVSNSFCVLSTCCLLRGIKGETESERWSLPIWGLLEGWHPRETSSCNAPGSAV